MTQDFFLSVLSSNSTKRESKTYIQRFRPTIPLSSGGPKSRSEPQPPKDTYYDPTQGSRPGVNLGSLYLPVHSVDQSPVFTQKVDSQGGFPLPTDNLRVAIVKIRALTDVDDSTLVDIARTLSQLGKLGLESLVVIDSTINSGSVPTRKQLASDGDRLAVAIDSVEGARSRRLNDIIGIRKSADEVMASVRIRDKYHVTSPNLLIAPLQRGQIPVILPVACDDESQISSIIQSDDVVLALVRELTGLNTPLGSSVDPRSSVERFKKTQQTISVDRIIVLDNLGGIPAEDRASGAHVFVNLEQEFDSIASFLLSEDVGTSKSAGRSQSQAHLGNLRLAKDALSLLPPSSSALLTTPEEAANRRKLMGISSSPGVGTRRQKNPLIHNLLTDKPVFSSSLPTGRLQPSPLQQQTATTPQPLLSSQMTTFIKRGMPLTILPNPETHPWVPPKGSQGSLSLKDSRVDLSRLIDLIEDSFDRKLDVEHYLSRIENRIAGIIIAGEYEGGALLTWEMPPHLEHSQSEEIEPQRLVPYLDKFAVLKRSQGTGGVADIVFKAMVRDCFPHGVCWRSRRNNPVNKWYFERARGTWKIPSANWTMFWTTEQAAVDRQLFQDYESVCRQVEPSWADKTGVID
ncbi:MAG: Amino-acid acetyltransferase, mitochondrial [Vezdaea aestivalis]|nr:MAG: Amino-acid acetyltransferase, mitochondrial [Vezdaea aestivalis]